MPGSTIDMQGSNRRPTEVARASAVHEIPIDLQQQFWNSWNGIFVGHERGPISQRQANIVVDWLEGIGRKDLQILEVGCGTGWMVHRLLPFGRVTGIDLSDAVLGVAQRNCPDAEFLAGDFMTMELAPASYDVIVTLEVLSHVADQPAFMKRIASLLKPGGQLMIATQNRPVLARSENVAPLSPGHIRHWVDHRELKALLATDFVLEEVFSICPHGHLGFLRLVNSEKLNRAAALLVPRGRIDSIKERLWLGHTLMARALK